MSDAGERTVPVSAGGWSVQPPTSSDPAILRFWLEFGEGGVKRDASIPPGRVYFTAAGWMDAEVEAGEKARSELLRFLEDEVLKDLKEAREEFHSERNPIKKVLKLNELAKLTTARDSTVAKLRTIDRTLPKRNDVLTPGPFPGVEGRFRMAGGGLSVRREKALGAEYHILGTWSAAPGGGGGEESA